MNERIAMGAEVGGVVGGLAELVLPHLDSAYNLARWLVGSGADAEDVVQEAYLRAFRYSSGFRGGDARSLLTIVRIPRTDGSGKREQMRLAQFDEDIHTSDLSRRTPSSCCCERRRTPRRQGVERARFGSGKFSCASWKAFTRRSPTSSARVGGHVDTVACTPPVSACSRRSSEAHVASNRFVDVEGRDAWVPPVENAIRSTHREFSDHVHSPHTCSPDVRRSGDLV